MREPAGLAVAPRLMRLDEAVDAFIQYRGGRGDVKPKSLKNLRAPLTHLLRVTGPDFRAYRIDRNTLAAWDASFSLSTTKTRTRYRTGIRVFCRWLIEQGELVANPALEMGWFRPGRRPLPIPPPLRDIVRLDDAVNAYLIERRAIGDIQPRTYDDLRARLVGLSSALGADFPVAEFNRDSLRSWLAGVGHLSPSSRRAYHSTVKGFCSWLVLEGFIASDPTVHLKPVRQPRMPPRALAAEDVTAVLDACKGDLRLRAITLLMVGCGLRCGEVCNLTVRDYDPVKRLVRVRGKGDNERIVPVPVMTVLALDQYLDGRNRDNMPLVISRRWGYTTIATYRNMDPRSMSKLMSDLMVEAGVHLEIYDKFTAHALRHTFATDVLAASNDVLAVQQLMGHMTLATTQRYLAPAGDERLRKAVEGRSYEPFRVVPETTEEANHA